MISDDELFISGTPPKIVEAVNTASLELCIAEEKSTNMQSFMDYRKRKNTSSSENVVMHYFLDLCPKMKSSPLLANHSMLKSTMHLKAM